MYSQPFVYHLSSISEFHNLLKSTEPCNGLLKLNVSECKTTHAQYKVINYDKNYLNNDLINTYGLCRSIVVNNQNKVVSFAPPKSMPADEFIDKYTTLDSNIIAQEFVEGTMINVFFDPSIGLTGGWELATRHTVGATSRFYSSTSKTFREMFMEAATQCALNIDTLDKNYCYSFVMQHPENRIVVPIAKPLLYLVEIYEIVNDVNTDTVDVTGIMPNQDVWGNTLCGTTVRIPDSYQAEKYADLIEKNCSMNSDYKIMGIVFKNYMTGDRTKVRNPVYEQVRHLRGNQPKLQYQYLTLRREGKVSDYLKYYPEHKRDFSSFRDQVHLFTDTLYSNYVSCYIKKQKPLSEFSDQYRTHMFNIHKHYIDELRENKLFVTNTVVQKYVNSLHSSLLMYCLNYDMRKRNIDIIVAENEGQLNE